MCIAHAIENPAPLEPTHIASADQTSIDFTLPSTETKKQKSRLRKKQEKKEKVRKIYTYRDMNYEELIVAKDALVVSKNYTSAIKYLEQMIKLSHDITLSSNHLLEIADLLFLDQQHEKASRLYSEFATMYPGSDKVEYALYRAIESSFLCLLEHDRDQTKTEETLLLTENFLYQDHFTEYKDAVMLMRTQCQEKLVLSEFNVCNFHLKRGRLKAANRRIEKVRTTWLPKLPSIEPQLIELEANLMLAQAQEELAKEKILLAQNNTRKKMTERF
jgi:outer membrane assembly lipoprotein YfiO